MYFDRTDICIAYYLYAALYHGGQGSKEYRIFGRLHKIGFKPPLICTEQTLSENQKEIFDNLVSKRKS